MKQLSKIIYKVFKICIKVPIGLFLLYILQLNMALYHRPLFKQEGRSLYNVDVYAQLQFIKQCLEKDAANKMQQIYPEGFLFMHLLYGLSWSNFARELDKTTPKFQEALKELDFCIEKVLSEQGKAIFHKDSPLEYGAYYVGWTNYLIGKKLALQTPSERDSAQVNHFLAKCDSIETILKIMAHPYPESYRQQAWPADASLCIAALALHDRLYFPKYKATIKNWVAGVKKHLDPKTGLIPHSVHYEDASMLEEPEGSSMSLTLVFMKEIDSVFGQQQFELYKEYFLAYRFGLPGIRAYAKGKKAGFNIDSGPVILGIGGAGSIVGQQVMALYGDWDSFHGLRNSIEAFGMAHTWRGKKCYVFGQVPMADAFIAWSNSMEIASDFNQAKNNWRWGFQLLSLGIWLLGLIVIWGWR